MKRRTKKHEARAKLRAARKAGQKRPGGSSRYARKAKFLHAHGGFGFQYSEPKPWKGGAS